MTQPTLPPTSTADRDLPLAPPEDAERRAALARLGVLAAWTAPAMLTLLVSRRASAGLSTQEEPCFPPPPPGKSCPPK